MMKWPQGRPGLNGENLASGQKPVNIRRRDVSTDYRTGSANVAMTDQQRDRRAQFKVERQGVGPNIPRPGVNRPLRSKKPPGIGAVNQATGSSSGYGSA